MFKKLFVNETTHAVIRRMAVGFYNSVDYRICGLESSERANSYLPTTRHLISPSAKTKAIETLVRLGSLDEISVYFGTPTNSIGYFQIAYTTILTVRGWLFEELFEIGYAESMRETENEISDFLTLYILYSRVMKRCKSLTVDPVFMNDDISLIDVLDSGNEWYVQLAHAICAEFYAPIIDSEGRFPIIVGEDSLQASDIGDFGFRKLYRMIKSKNEETKNKRIGYNAVLALWPDEMSVDREVRSHLSDLLGSVRPYWTRKAELLFAKFRLKVVSDRGRFFSMSDLSDDFWRLNAISFPVLETDHEKPNLKELFLSRQGTDSGQSSS